MPLSRLLKALLPSFLPLLAFILADSLFGERIGLAVGLGIGLAELLFHGLRERRLEPFLLADTLLLGAAGGLSLLLSDGTLLKLKPAIVELVFGGGLGLLLLQPERRLLEYFERQLRGIKIEPSALPALRRKLGLLLVLLGAHALLTAWAAFALSTAAWGFVSGGLLYLLFGLFLGFEWLRALRSRRGLAARAGARPGEEILPLVDEEGRIIGAATRADCHRGPGKLHPVVHLHLTDGEGGFYLQKRSTSKEVEPGKWDCGAAGHLIYGEGLDAALLRELREELGVNALALDAAGAHPEALFRYRAEGAESELVFVFGLRYAGPVAPDGEEVAEGRFWRHAEIEAALGRGIFTSAFEREWAMLKNPPIGEGRNADPARGEESHIV